MVREGRLEDLAQVRDLIVELAVFEREPNAVSNTLEMMERDGFGPNPKYGFFVAEHEEKIVGISLYYYRYSTWKGPCLYLEDLIVTEAQRGRGFGKALFERTLQFAKEEGLPYMSWQVLDWNQSAIDFYGRYGAEFDGEWVNCRVDVPK